VHLMDKKGGGVGRRPFRRCGKRATLFIASHSNLIINSIQRCVVMPRIPKGKNLRSEFLKEKCEPGVSAVVHDFLKARYPGNGSKVTFNKYALASGYKEPVSPNDRGHKQLTANALSELDAMIGRHAKTTGVKGVPFSKQQQEAHNGDVLLLKEARDYLRGIQLR